MNSQEDSLQELGTLQELWHHFRVKEGLLYLGPFQGGAAMQEQPGIEGHQDATKVRHKIKYCKQEFHCGLLSILQEVVAKCS